MEMVLLEDPILERWYVVGEKKPDSMAIWT